MNRLSLYLIFTIFMGNPLFQSHSVILCGSYEGNPLSSPKGEAECGEHPLDPLFFKEYYFQPSQELSHLGDTQAAGAEARCAKSPKRAIDCLYEDFSKAFFLTISVLFLPIQSLFFSLPAVVLPRNNSR
jgi:hypothetical protein